MNKSSQPMSDETNIDASRTLFDLNKKRLKKLAGIHYRIANHEEGLFLNQILDKSDTDYKADDIVAITSFNNNMMEVLLTQRGIAEYSGVSSPKGYRALEEMVDKPYKIGSLRHEISLRGLDSMASMYSGMEKMYLPMEGDSSQKRIVLHMM